MLELGDRQTVVVLHQAQLIAEHKSFMQLGGERDVIPQNSV